MVQIARILIPKMYSFLFENKLMLLLQRGREKDQNQMIKQNHSSIKSVGRVFNPRKKKHSEDKKNNGNC